MNSLKLGQGDNESAHTGLTNMFVNRRLAMLKDSFSIVVVSLDLHKRQNALLFECHKLPSSAQKIIAVPAPIGGFVVVGSNFLLFLDQTTRIGVSINVHLTSETDETFKYDQSELDIDATDCQATFLTQYGQNPSTTVTTVPLLLATTNVPLYRRREIKAFKGT